MPVNHMHYIKCCVNSSLLTLLWLLQKVCDLQIYFGVIFHKTMHLKQAHITSGAFIHRAIFVAVTSTQTAAHLG